MPFKSEAQKRKFYELKKQGKMSQAEIDKWEKETPAKIPDRLHWPKVKKVKVIK